MDAALYMAEHASRRVANAFMDEFERVAEFVELFPALGTPDEEGYRVYPFSKFKYSLVYFDSDHGPLILAVAPQRREPGYWTSRISRN